MDVKIVHNKHFARYSITVFKEFWELIEKHGIGECILFVWRWAVNTKEIVPLIVKGDGQLVDFKT